MIHLARRISPIMRATILLCMIGFAALQLTGNANGDLLDVLGGLENRLHSRLHKAHELVQQIFAKIGHDPNSTVLEKFFPQAIELLKNRVHKLAKCYDASVGKEKLDIFKRPLGTIVLSYIVSLLAYKGSFSNHVIGNDPLI